MIKKRWQNNSVLILLSIILILIIDNIDATAVNLAVPTLMKEFGITVLTAGWILNLYIGASAIFFLFAGYIAKVIGTKKAMLVGIFMIGFSSSIIGFAGNLPMFFIGRFLEGIGYALTFAFVFIVVKRYVPESWRRFSIQVIASIAAITTTSGPIIGGFFVYYLNWRWIFYINIPLSLFCYVLLNFFMHEEHQKMRIRVMDMLSLFLFMLSLFCLILFLYSIIQNSKTGVFYGLMFIILSFSYWIFERRHQTKAVSLGDFKIQKFRYVIFDRFVIQSLSFSFFFAAPLFLEGVINKNSIVSGQYISLMTLTSALASILCGLLFKNVSVNKVITINFAILLSACLFWLVYIDLPHIWLLLLSFIMFGLAFGVLYPQVNAKFVSSLPDVKCEESTSGLYNSLSFLFAAIGVSCTSTLLSIWGDSSLKSYKYFLLIWAFIIGISILIKIIEYYHRNNLHEVN